MAQTPPPAMTAAPTPAPLRNDRATFSTRVDAFVTWLIAAVAEFAAAMTNVYNNAVDAYNSSLTATAQATAAAAAANAIAWVSGTTYVIGDGRYSPLNFQTYRRRTNGAGTTDPSLDSTNWALLGAPSAWTVITADPANAVAGANYDANTTAAAFSITLPTAPAVGDAPIGARDYIGTWATNALTFARNGNLINGIAEDMSCHTNWDEVSMTWVGGSVGWRAS